MTVSLQYNILWLDDRKDEYQTLKIDKNLEEYVKSLFFEPHIFMYETIKDAEQNLKTRKYDVIFSDYNIGENENGKNFINNVRNQNVNAEVLFYSALKTLPQIEVDRISFLRLQNNTSYDDLEKKMKSVIGLTIEKLNDLTNLRGLVMAEVSELDVMMKNLVADYCKKDAENEKELRNYIVGKLDKRLKKSLEAPSCNKECFHKWKNEPVTNIVFEQNFDSYTTAMALNHILNKISAQKKQFLCEYNATIIQNRNILAHCYTKQKESGSEVLVTQKGDKEFSSEDINEIRKNIITYHKLFEDFKETLNHVTAHGNTNTNRNVPVRS